MSTATASLKSFAVAVAVLCAATGSSRLLTDAERLEGRAPTAEELRPSVEAAFQGESVKQGTVASLVLFNRARGLTLQILRTGPEHTPTVGNSELQGVPVTPVKAIGSGAPGRLVHVQIGKATSGCISLRCAALLHMLRWLSPTAAPRIVIGTHAGLLR